MDRTAYTLRMKLRPLEASLFKKLPTEVQQQFLQSKVVPVNDVFFKEWRNTNKINLYYGSYGSGKSVFIVDILLAHCIEDTFFRCYYGRKILETVRGTVFKTITDRIKELNLEDDFYFSDKPNGSMTVICKQNGNEFNPFGANNPESLKSIKDPTHFFCEEFDQFKFEDFGFIFSRLRTERAVTQLYAAFNTERVYKSHWIRAVLFEGEYKEMCYKLMANYTDNYFIDQEVYYEKLKLIANGNIMVLNAIAGGQWGSMRTGGEFLNQFNESKHVRKLTISKNPLHISLDENITPYVTCSVWQIDTFNKELKQVHELAAKEPDNNAPKAAKLLVRWLLANNYEDTIFVYGDPSASARSTVDENNASFYDKYIAVLQEYGFSVIKRVKKSAPQVSLSRDFVNAILENNYDGWKIMINDHCFTSIEDYILAKADANGKMLKTKVKDDDTGVTYEPIGHFSDALRYFITAILEDIFKRFNSRKRSLITTQ